MWNRRRSGSLTAPIGSGGIAVTPSQGGTGTTTVFTAGSVPFAGASGVYTQNNGNFFWDNTNNRLGLGTSSPGARLDVTRNSLGGAGNQSLVSGIVVVNTTAAAAGVQQISPAVRWRGNGWKTTATAASQTVDFQAYVVPVQGSANPTGYLTFESSVNAGTFGNTINFLSTGSLIVGDTTTVTGFSRELTVKHLTTGNNTSVNAVGARSGASQSVGQLAVYNFQSSQAFPLLVIGVSTGASTNDGVVTFSTGSGGSAVEAMRVSSTQNVSFGGISTPTARVHLPSGGTGASSAPLKFTVAAAGQTTGEVGAVEFFTAGGNNILTLVRTGTTREVVLTGSVTSQTTTGIDPNNVFLGRDITGNIVRLAIATI